MSSPKTPSSAQFRVNPFESCAGAVVFDTLAIAGSPTESRLCSGSPRSGGFYFCEAERLALSPIDIMLARRRLAPGDAAALYRYCFLDRRRGLAGFRREFQAAESALDCAGSGARQMVHLIAAGVMPRTERGLDLLLEGTDALARHFDRALPVTELSAEPGCRPARRIIRHLMATP